MCLESRGVGCTMQQTDKCFERHFGCGFLANNYSGQENDFVRRSTVGVTAVRFTIGYIDSFCLPQLILINISESLSRSCVTLS